MTDPITPLAAASAATVYIAKAVYEFVKNSRNGNSADHRKCKAEDVQSRTQASLDAQTDLLREIKDSQKDTRDGVMELVTISRRK